SLTDVGEHDVASGAVDETRQARISRHHAVQRRTRLLILALDLRLRFGRATARYGQYRQRTNHQVSHHSLLLAGVRNRVLARFRPTRPTGMGGAPHTVP